MPKCLYAPCNNKVATKGTYCLETYGDCARADAPRLHKRSADFRSSRVPGQWADQLKHVRSAAKAVRAFPGRVVQSVKDAQQEVFRMRYAGPGGYDRFVKDQSQHRFAPDPFSGKEHRELNTEVHNLGVFYGVEFPKDIRKRPEAKFEYLQGFARGQSDLAVREHIINALSLALQRDHERNEQELAPLELLEAMKAKRAV